MNVLISLVMAVAPSVLLLLWFLRRDRARPEPAGLVLRMFLMGLVLILPALLLEIVLDHLSWTLGRMAYPLVRGFLVVALVEESLKLLAVIRLARRRACFDEVMDGIVYTVAAGLGFACLENVLFVLGRGMGVAVLRALTAVPMHAAVSAVMGYYFGRGRMAGGGEGRLLAARGLAIAVLLHGSYNAFLFGVPVWDPSAAVGAILALLVSVILALRLTRRALHLDREAGLVPQAAG